MENPYLSPARIKAALRSLDLRPSRGMGQHFLTDRAALEAIVAGAELSPTDTIVEVGPGLGVLTWELLQRAGHVVVVELDKRLAARLQEEFHSPKLTLVQGDILTLAPGALLAADEATQRPPYKLVANIPYSITSPLLRHFLEADYKPSLMVILVQWEVAKRITAKPGDLSVLAHAIQVYAEPEILLRVPTSSFVPAPAVDSAILRLHVRPQPAVDVDVDQLLRVVKAGFLHSRKKLSNALPGGLAAMGWPNQKEQVLEALQAAGVDPARRAETLTLEEWAQLYRQLAARRDQ